MYWDSDKDTIGDILGIYWDNGKENGNYYIIIGDVLGIYWDNGKDHGNYNLGFWG